MYSNDDIMNFVNLVAEITDPDKVILFGSYAYGNPSDKSDLDLLVIKNGKELSIDDETKFDLALFNEKRRRKIKMRYDIFYGTDKQVREIAENGGSFIDALQKGRIIYERSNTEKRRTVL